MDSGPVRAHLERLREAGFSWRQIAAISGVTDAAFHCMGDRVQAGTAAKVFAVPVPDLADGNRYIPAVGTVRRVQALAAMGWPQVDIAQRVGMGQRQLSHMLRQDSVRAKTAKRIRGVFDELHMTPGPSRRTRLVARNWGYVTSLAWDDIDDPDEAPNIGIHAKTTADERIAELRELGVHSIDRIAERLDIKPSSVERQLFPSRARSKEAA